MNHVEREALRYLGVRGPDARAEALVAECFDALSAAVPRHALRVLPAQEVERVFESRTLSRHLQGADEAALLAATLGAEADRLIRRAEAVDTLRAAALHACAAAKIEAYVDEVQSALPGAARSRFSPGYGDLSLDRQQALLDLLDAGRRLGLYLTAGQMLVPSKSITAIVAIGPRAEDRAFPKCAACDKKDCAYRTKRGVSS